MADWVDVNGVVLRYALSRFDGPPLVLVHELSGMLESWDGVVSRLAGRCQILRYDLRGFGLSEKISGDVRLEQLVDDLAALLDRLGFPTTVTLAGSAVGAAVALGFALRHPERVSALIAMAPALGMPVDRRPSALAFADRLDARGMRAATDTTGAAPSNDFERRMHLRRITNDPRCLAAYYRMLADLDMTEALAKIACPLLLLAGERDALRPPASLQHVAETVQNGQMRTVAAGHFMQIEVPDIVADEIAAFMALPPAGARS